MRREWSSFALAGAGVVFCVVFCVVLCMVASGTCAAQSGKPAPAPGAGPTPVVFRSKDGRFSGWKIAIPGDRPLASAAVVAGKVFVGGGFGSHEFYAFDAATGRRIWTYHTADDGPTAAVVGEGMVVFNTESCELEVLTSDGKPVWKKWLGDPLMSIPAISNGQVYMAYPNSRGDHKYYLASFDLKTGREIWKQPLAGEIITAPVIEQQRVYAATVDGALAAFDQHTGSKVWEEKKNATSAPAVWNGLCYFSRREETKLTKGGKTVVQQNELIASKPSAPATPVRDMAATRRQADYLDYSKRASSAVEVRSQSLDAAVGFSVAKGSAPVAAMQANLGQGSVHGIWAYQGSKPFVDAGRVYSSMGNAVMSVVPETGKVLWSRTLHEDKGSGLLNSVLTPPAIVNGKVFVGTSFGEVVVLSQQSGEVLWRVEVGEPVVFQPTVAGGRVYVSTNKGSVFCFGTGDSRDDGWLMWGANGAHNGLKVR